MSPTSRRISFLAVAVCVLGLLVWAYLFHARHEWALADYKKQMRGAGERLSVDELLPRPLVLESNGARIILEAQRHLPAKPALLDTNPPQAMQMVALGKALVGWKQLDMRDEGTNTWEQVETELERESEVLDPLEQLIETPSLDFHLDYHQGYNLLLPHLAKLKQLAQRLKSAALYDLHKGDPARAITRTRSILALGNGLAYERLVISQLVRLSITHIAVSANWELLQSSTVTEQQLAELQKEWMALDFIEGAANALLMERAVGEQTADELRESSANYRSIMGTRGGSGGDWLGNLGQAAAEKGKETMWRYAWSYPDQLKGLQGKQTLLAGLRSLKDGEPYKSVLESQKRELAKLGIEQRSKDDDGLLFSGEDPRYMFTDSVLALERFPHRLMSAEIARQLLVTAIGLKRYQLKHGSNPPSLAALVPEFLPPLPHGRGSVMKSGTALPCDPVDGEPLRYKLNSDGTFLLWSIGEDGVDNGGDPVTPPNTKSFPWLKGRDVVWPVPATDAEVSARHEKIHGGR